MKTVSSALMAGGDTDTVAAIAGAISGAHNGPQHMPQHLVAQVESAQRLKELGQAIYDLATQDKG
jgi:ADP-ribosylglycohydrolase